MKKIRFSLSFRFKKPTDSRAMIRSAATAIVFLYAAWLLWLLYHTVYPNLIAQRTPDPSQVTAKQEQVNRKLLDSIMAYDEAKRRPVDFQDVNDPFSR